MLYKYRENSTSRPSHSAITPPQSKSGRNARFCNDIAVRGRGYPASPSDPRIKPRGPRRHTPPSLTAHEGTPWHLHRDRHRSRKCPQAIVTTTTVLATALDGNNHTAFPAILVSVLHPRELNEAMAYQLRQVILGLPEPRSLTSRPLFNMCLVS